MKKFNFGKIFALMAAGAAVFALVFAGCDQLNDAIKSALDQPKAVADAESLAAAFADSSVKIIEIQDNITADSLELSIPAGDKTISIPGGKETAIGSLELSAGSHVKIMNGSGGTAKSVGGALAAAYSEQNYDGWATLVIWNNFKIPAGATFDLIGRVRLVFRVAEVEGTLKAEIEDSLLGAGDEKPEIKGDGYVQTSKDAEEKTPELAAADIKNSDTHKAPPQTLDPPVPPGSLDITFEGTGIMDKGDTRQFTANRAVTWTVEGGSEKGGTSITAGGLLTVGADEANITLTVKAASGGDTATETVKVKGWKTITSGTEIFGTNQPINGITYGAGKWVAVGGKPSTSQVDGTPKIAYSTDGESWTAVTNLSPSKESINAVVYDGPENGKKFIALADKGIIYYSTDGIDWTGVTVTTGDDKFVFNGAAYGNGTFIAVGWSTTAQKKVGGVATSANGETWEWKGIPSALDDVKNITGVGGRQIAFHGDKFMVALGAKAAIATTTNGTDMDLVAYSKLGNTIRDNTMKGYPEGYNGAWSRQIIIFANGQWITAGAGNTVAFAPENDTSTWKPIDFDAVGYTTNPHPYLAEGGGKLVIARTWEQSSNTTGFSIIYASTPLTEGQTWKSFDSMPVPDKATFVQAIAYGDNKFIVGGSKGWMAVAHEETLE
ncbi:MAG: hypothetical protein LBJ86_07645 [Spirochaetaceae bacterium]|jgi:hypothetical protein|nr:hypothetical protein [Spirochaetaceae bacterium]